MTLSVYFVIISDHISSRLFIFSIFWRYYLSFLFNFLLQAPQQILIVGALALIIDKIFNVGDLSLEKNASVEG